MDKPSFEEGIFCWKGFIYYKWSLNELVPILRPIIKEIANIQTSDTPNYDDQLRIVTMKKYICGELQKTCRIVMDTINIYDTAYKNLTTNGQPLKFREFLLSAPGLFYDIGERIGLVQHIVSFWRFRFPENSRIRVSAPELADLLSEFEFSLCGADRVSAH